MLGSALQPSLVFLCLNLHRIFRSAWLFEVEVLIGNSELRLLGGKQLLLPRVLALVVDLVESILEGDHALPGNAILLYRIESLIKLNGSLAQIVHLLVTWVKLQMVRLQHFLRSVKFTDRLVDPLLLNLLLLFGCHIIVSRFPAWKSMHDRGHRDFYLFRLLLAHSLRFDVRIQGGKRGLLLTLMTKLCGEVVLSHQFLQLLVVFIYLLQV